MALVLALGLVGPLAYVGPLGLAPLIGLAAIPNLGAKPARLPPTISWPVWTLVLWAAISLAWTPAHPWTEAHSLISALEHLTLAEIALFAGLSLMAVKAALNLSPRQALLCARVASASALVLAGILIADSLAGGRIYGQLASLAHRPVTADLARIYAARGGYVLAVLMWPLLGMRLVRWWVVGWVCALAVTLVSALLHETAPFAALVLGATAFAVVAASGRYGLAIFAGLQTGYWLMEPRIMRAVSQAVDLGPLTTAMRPSWSERVGIWRFAAERVAEQPWRGWGMDASRAFIGHIPLHPHNWALQIWLELGLPGAVIAAGFGLGLWRLVAGLPDRLQMASAAGALTAYLTIGAISFGLWQTWWLSVGALAAVTTIVVRRSRPIEQTMPWTPPLERRSFPEHGPVGAETPTVASAPVRVVQRPTAITVVPPSKWGPRTSGGVNCRDFSAPRLSQMHRSPLRRCGPICAALSAFCIAFWASSSRAEDLCHGSASGAPKTRSSAPPALIYENRPLADVARDLTHLGPRTVSTDADTKGLRFTGVLVVDDQKSMIGRLSKLLRIRASCEGAVIVLKRRAG